MLQVDRQKQTSSWNIGRPTDQQGCQRKGWGRNQADGSAPWTGLPKRDGAAGNQAGMVVLVKSRDSVRKEGQGNQHTREGTDLPPRSPRTQPLPSSPRIDWRGRRGYRGH